MKLRMAQNSLFAILLRSPWWISIGVAALLALAAGALLPSVYVVAGMMGALPFLAIGSIAAWRQWRAPDPRRLAATLERARGMNWREFGAAMQAALGHADAKVTPLQIAGADFRVDDGDALTLVSCRRWKAATHGIEGLRELQAACAAQGAHHGSYVYQGNLTDPARRFAQEHGLQLLTGQELALLLAHSVALAPPKH